MAYVINGGEKPTIRFQLFVDLCCQAYNLIRKQTNLFLNLLSLVIVLYKHLTTFILMLLYFSNYKKDIVILE